MIGDGHGKRPWVYQASSTGFFRSVHRYSGAVLLAIFFATPWIRLGGLPVFLMDLPGRRVFLLGETFTALDTRFLLVAGLLASIGLGLFTAIAGRIWCGYLCPQTVFLEEIIRRIETWVEGDRGARRKLDMEPWTRSKATKKAVKWSLFVLVCVVLAMNTMAYFIEASVLWSFQAPTVTYTLVAILAGLLYFDLAWFREQFCNYLCPYARVQGVLTDIHSLTIGYDTRRGEPRLGTAGVKKQDVFGRGGCVDCNKCVAVCPQGIDIRDGFQLECIACGHCIDACTSVMAKFEVPSLIQYTTEARLRDLKEARNRVRPWVYAGIMAAVASAGLFFFFTRETYDARIIRMRGTYGELREDGRVQNTFDAHIWNNRPEERVFTVSAEGLDGAEVISALTEIRIPANSDRQFPVFVVAPRGTANQRSVPFELVVHSGDETLEQDATFIVPGAQP
jgi:cytochrome c oxidase accessory protein FixG